MNLNARTKGKHHCTAEKTTHIADLYRTTTVSSHVLERKVYAGRRHDRPRSLCTQKQPETVLRLQHSALVRQAPTTYNDSVWR